jgi:hypothetical protein
MTNSKLFLLYKTFTKAELRQFRLFLQSPFFNQREDVQLLNDFLQKNIEKSPNDAVFQKELVWKAVFPKKTYSDKEMRYTMSYLLDLAEKFIILQEQNSDPKQQQIAHFQALKKRGLSKMAENLLESNPQNDSEQPQYWKMRQIQRDVLLQQGKFSYEDKIQYLDDFTVKFFTEVLKEACIWISAEKQFEDAPFFDMMNVVVNQLKKNAQYPDKNALLKIYYFTYLIHLDKEVEKHDNFNMLKSTLFSLKIEDFPSNAPEIAEIWLIIINYSIKKQNQGNRAFVEEALSLYLKGIELGILLENGQISKKTYSNILVLYILKGDLTSAEQFLFEYKIYLPERERENTYLHNLATLYFKKRAFSQVLATLQGVQFTDMLHNMEARRLLLCSYYELGEENALESLLDSFGIWLKRSKHLGYHRDLYANLVKLVRKLIESKYQNKEVREKLRQEINETKLLAGREWLLEKVG